MRRLAADDQFTDVPDVIGYADLDDYGKWNVVEGYGNVWVPTSVPSAASFAEESPPSTKA